MMDHLAETAGGLGDVEFRRLASLAYREFGLSLSDSKKPLVQSRLSRRLRALGVSEFAAYLDIVEAETDGVERRELISALTTNVTSFFREQHHFDLLRTACLPSAIERAKAGGRLRIWSAGCSSGQEPYSIAMVLLDMWPEAADRDVRILATDIDPKIVERARQGRYSAEDWDSIPNSYQGRFVTRSTGSETIEIAAPVRDMITFAELNLVADWPFAGPFEAIFCRNVAIYFDQPTQQRLWARFSNLLRPDGHLYIGHSERVTGIALQTLAMAGVTSYRRSGPSGTEMPERNSTWA